MRHRSRVVFMDTPAALTRGESLPLYEKLRWAPDQYLSVVRQPNNQLPLLGQVEYRPGDRCARITFVMPEDAVSTDGMLTLLEDQMQEAGKRGAFCLRADAEDQSAELDALRRSGFTVYARQRVWRLNSYRKNRDETQQSPNRWTVETDRDGQTVRSFVNALVPPLVQAAEQLQDHRGTGLLYEQGGELTAYVRARSGSAGIVLHPLFHPAAEDVPGLMQALLNDLKNDDNKPIYLIIRSYQAWLESALDELDLQALKSQSVLVKHLAARVSVPVPAMQSLPLETRMPTVSSSTTASLQLISEIRGDQTN
ncbi:MAG TPA: hypothetical protein PKD55_17685 [Bellilinea sp.]|nr:hypothetical protein [Bellilinea sp.]